MLAQIVNIYVAGFLMYYIILRFCLDLKYNASFDISAVLVSFDNYFSSSSTFSYLFSLENLNKIKFRLQQKKKVTSSSSSEAGRKVKIMWAELIELFNLAYTLVLSLVFKRSGGC